VSFLYADERVLVATVGPIVVPVVGKLGYSVESAKAQARAIEKHGRSLGAERMTELSLIDGEVPVPDASVRAVLDENVPAISPYYRAVSAVFPGSGFRAALVRGVIMSFQLLGRTSYPSCWRLDAPLPTRVRRSFRTARRARARWRCLRMPSRRVGPPGR